ncbi:MAG: diguanylate cyclase [Caldiserica bacterium]|jgi:diguanylate cyclase (GGDEF)-like protein/PAS domain S-box-containing protein|nr:diguanylate cyclase [Caldisericota bacterium]
MNILQRLNPTTLRAILDRVADGVYLVSPDRTIIFWSRGAEEIAGFKTEDMVGRHCNESGLQHIDDNGKNLCETACPLIEAFEKERLVEKEVWVHTKEGGLKHILVRSIPTYGENGEIIGATETFTEITAFDRLRAELKVAESLAILDPLTHLPNRRLLDEVFPHLRGMAERGEARIFLVFLDLNHFKEINDRFGHLEGDRLLKSVGLVLEKEIRAGDWVFSHHALRYGGDEFLLIFILPGGSPADSEKAILERLWHLISQIRTPLGPLEAAIGGTFLKDGEELKEALHRVDKLMYQSKKEGEIKLDSTNA